MWPEPSLQFKLPTSSAHFHCVSILSKNYHHFLIHSFRLHLHQCYSTVTSCWREKKEFVFFCFTLCFISFFVLFFFTSNSKKEKPQLPAGALQMEALQRPANSAASMQDGLQWLGRRERQIYCRQCLVFRWRGPIIQSVSRSLWVGAEGDGYSKKHENLFSS